MCSKRFSNCSDLAPSLSQHSYLPASKTSCITILATPQTKAQLAPAISSTPTPSTACLLGAMSNSGDQARRDVNNALINAGSKNVSSMVDAGNSSREKRAKNKREKDAREAAEKEKADVCPSHCGLCNARDRGADFSQYRLPSKLSTFAYSARLSTSARSSPAANFQHESLTRSSLM